VEVVNSLYDPSGVSLGKLRSTLGLEPHGTWKFEALIIHGNVASFEWIVSAPVQNAVSSKSDGLLVPSERVAADLFGGVVDQRDLDALALRL